ncbi:hypothetical protein H6P81_003177 [Aristolochia fimbriata]|uniref:NB-ARC domain-containing protein n=1 Tax=Aristolochia fimbriata TaxID=158543 RepID=A0AAV7FCE7_ARIFI|nr:hypothetical protein H6P81_003177 [Aristolochia fimbriata]
MAGELTSIGYEIVKKCKGLPLAVKTLAGCLQGESNVYVWNKILQSKTWNLPDDQNDIIGALKVSFNYLPAHLKLCFSYCSIFPNGYEFDKYELVLMWSAAGFVLATGGIPSETLGAQYFDDLVSRYLDLSWTHIRSLPERIGTLKFLQTLKLNGCSELLQLPATMGISGASFKLMEMPLGMAMLIELQTLSKFVLRKKTPCGISDLMGMRKLRGTLSISKFENIASVEEARAARMKETFDLQGLELSWTDSNDIFGNGLEEEVVEVLRPPKELKYLSIFCFKSRTLPTWLSCLSHLESIRLFNCRKCKSIPSLASLPRLKKLVMIGLYELKHIEHNLCQDGEGAFPCLLEFEITNCQTLVELPYLPSTLKNTSLQDDANNFFNISITSASGWFQSLTALNKLEIRHMSELQSLSSEGILNGFISLQDLVISDCPGLMALPGLESMAEEELPTMLKELRISACRNLKSKSA